MHRWLAVVSTLCLLSIACCSPQISGRSGDIDTVATQMAINTRASEKKKTTAPTLTAEALRTPRTTATPTSTPLPTSKPASLSSPASTPLPAMATAPSQAPTSTPTSSVRFPAPVLVGPPDGATFNDSDEIVLEWQSVGQLPGEAYYEVQVLFAPRQDPTQVWKDEIPWMKDTRWTLSEHLYLFDLASDGQFTWSAQVVQKTGEDADGRPVGIPVSPMSASHRLFWKPRLTGGEATATPRPP